ncbi:DUF2207 domain-containing protein [Microtetraspora sp. AC03309]|uniref:DUF2207 domain-containing protein n=1 Tax=Microtetraspora sp. AC03309 TaxID=2779376 RepID=UPI001E578EBB|nr:DUF2207 domain-containing protein [Microtetraspora sp. AC03309]MCC5579667.1 DUF2207 domain-containing protein [Microtetraspora sp. AC03309]
MVDLARRLGLAALFAVLALLTVGTPAHADPATVAKDDVTMELRKDGVLHVVEKITLSGAPMRRTLLTRTRYDDGNDRVYRVSNLKGASFDGEAITFTGSGTVEYDVTGAVTPLTGGEELRWFAVAGPAEQVTVTVSGPGRAESLSCFAGEPASAIGCTGASIDETGAAATFEQQGLRDGEVLTIVVGYPKGATGAAPILEHRFELANAFTLNAVTGGALALLLLLLGGGVGLLYWTRGRDARVVGAQSGVVVAHQNGQFTPPDGVRPGQIGTLIDEQADVIDVTATIVDLAVRGYLRIDEQPRQAYDAPDWLLVRLPSAPVASLLPYERALYDAVFDGRDTVLLSQLHGSFTAGLGKVRDELYQDVVTQGWFARRPDSVRTRWTTVGVVATVLGVVATVALAWFTTYALVGLALIIAGAALAVGGQYMPAKTAKGAAVLAHTLGLREHLASGEIGSIPPAQRIELFSRYLPYAVVFDGVDRWARVVASIDGDGRPADNLYWYQGPAEWDLSKFADSMRTFTMTTSGAISAARLFRSF